MSTVLVNVANKKSYPINIGQNLIDRLNFVIPDDTTAIALITNSQIGNLYGNRAIDSLNKTKIKLIRIDLPNGEIYKNWETLNKIFDNLLKNGFDRRSVLVALGGGVIGDVVGFAAATYMRGIRFIQVPTTLLAQVDSSIGGKTGINHFLGKNMIGAFHQPISVEIDTNLLNTLNLREVSAGLAEIIKYGLILDRNFWLWCENNIDSLLNLDHSSINYAIQRSCELKSFLVSKDEQELGLRSILNLGHTFGHAIELGLGYGTWLHGEAVGCGLVQAAKLSADILGLLSIEVNRIQNLVSKINCPVELPNFSIDKWLDLIHRDKKTDSNNLRFVLIPKIGKAMICNITDDQFSDFIQKFN